MAHNNAKPVCCQPYRRAAPDHPRRREPCSTWRRRRRRRRFDLRAYTPPLDEVFDAYRGRPPR